MRNAPSLYDPNMEGTTIKQPVTFSATMEVPFSGINGLRYGPKTHYVYYTTSSQDLFMRVAADPATHEPIADPEHIADVPSVDDLCLDENAGVAYIARHPDHIIERVPLKRGSLNLRRASIAAAGPTHAHRIRREKWRATLMASPQEDAVRPRATA